MPIPAVRHGLIGIAITQQFCAAQAFVGRTPDTIQHFLACIVESSDDAILSKDSNGVLTSWNPAPEQLFGYSAEEAVGNQSTILIPEDPLNEERIIL